MSDTGSQEPTSEEVHQEGIKHVSDNTDKPGSNETAGENKSSGDNVSNVAPQKRTGKLENRDAIPIAGGERLGDKHWGESQMVPDNPPSQPEQQISSAEGQPDKQTADNTAQNMGSAQPPSSGESQDQGGEKPSLLEKIKDKVKG